MKSWLASIDESRQKPQVFGGCAGCSRCPGVAADLSIHKLCDDVGTGAQRKLRARKPQSQ